MYYSHPEKEAAYHCPNQYWFGSELMVSPVTEKNDTCALLGKTKVWFPKGIWIDVFNGNVYGGEGEMEVYRSMEQMPVFAKAGAIVPIQLYEGDNRLGRKENMELLVFAGADNQFTLYEDEGDYSDYKKGVSAKTKVEFSWKNEAVLRIHPVSGEASLLPEKRNWTVKLVGVKKLEQKVVTEDVSECDMAYDEHTATAVIKLVGIDVYERSGDSLSEQRGFAV